MVRILSKGKYSNYYCSAVNLHTSTYILSSTRTCPNKGFEIETLRFVILIDCFIRLFMWTKSMDKSDQRRSASGSRKNDLEPRKWVKNDRSSILVNLNHIELLRIWPLCSSTVERTLLKWEWGPDRTLYPFINFV